MNIINPYRFGGGWSPKDLTNIISYCRSWEGLNKTGTAVDSLDDLTGNGFNWSATGTNKPSFDGIDNIGGVDAIRFSGNTNELLANVTMTYADSSEAGYFIVFEITDAVSGGGYHNIFILNVLTGASAGSNFLQFYNPNTSANFINNYPNNAYDSTITEGSQFNSSLAVCRKVTGQADYYLNGTETVKTAAGTNNVFSLNQNYIGSWGGNHSKMLLCEFGVFDTMSDAELLLLESYVNTKYGI